MYEESTLHYIRDCVVAKVVWERLLPPNLKNDFFLGELEDWLLWILRLSSMTNAYQGWPKTVAMVCWLQ